MVAVAPEATPREGTKPEEKPTASTPLPDLVPPFVPETAPEPAVEKPAEPERAGPSPPMRALAASKPAVVRVKIFSLKKPELIDLCKAYDLDSSGTKEQLQERLLSYLHDLEAEEQGEAPGEPLSMGAPAKASTEASVAAGPETGKAEAATPPAAALASAAPAQSVLVEEEKPAPAAPVLVTAAPAPVVVEVPRPVVHVEHPCPNCGRELSFITQYNRWYCYFCQRYAPATKSKNACPTCGATMRWIDQHQRWWCDACQKYAPADLPPPSGVVTKAAATAAVVPQATARPAIMIHHHGSAGTGIGLIGFGLALYVIVEFFATLAPLANLPINNPFTGEMAALTEFFAILFIAAGTMLGLWSMRDHP